MTAIVGRPGSAPTARRTISASAAARRCAAVRVGPPEARSARQSRSYSSAMAARTTSPSSLVYKASSAVVPANVLETCNLSPSPRSPRSPSGSALQQPVLQHHRAVWSTVSRRAWSTSSASSLREHLERLVAAMRGRRQQRRLREPRSRPFGSRPEWSAWTPAVVPFAPASPPTTGSAHTDTPTTPYPRSLRRMPTLRVPHRHRPSHRRLDPTAFGVEPVRAGSAHRSTTRIDLPHLGHAPTSSRTQHEQHQGEVPHHKKGV